MHLTQTTTVPEPTKRDLDDCTLNVGEHASFSADNREGWGTYSMLAFFIGFLGAGPLYLTFTRDAHGS